MVTYGILLKTVLLKVSPLSNKMAYLEFAGWCLDSLINLQFQV